MSREKEERSPLGRRKPAPKYLYLDKFERYKEMTHEKLSIREKASHQNKKDITLLRLEIQSNKQVLYTSIVINIVLFIILFANS